MTRPRPLQIVLAALIALATGCQSPDRHPPSIGMVVSGDSLASAAGLAVLERGGNAVDAAVATGFALAACYPEAGNIGGGGFMLIRMPDGTARSIDFRETAPRRATADMFSGRPEASVDGALASGTPGTVAGLLLALERFGTLDREALLRPAFRIAAGGFRIDSRLAASLAAYRDELGKHPSTRKIYFPGGTLLHEGDLLVQPDLAATFRRIIDSGAAGFYRGPTAALIAAEMARGGGLIDTGDLAAYRAIERTPLRGTYRGYTIDAMGPPSSGGICLLTALSLLEPYDLRGQGFHSLGSVHLIAEAMKRSFALRASYLGDADFVKVPVERLLEASARPPLRAPINHRHSSVADSIAGYPWSPREGTETTHFSVIDARGMAVAVTFTINDLFGNKEVVDGAGFFLNDEMDDFVTVPGEPNMYGLVGGPENMIAGGKRPLSSMTPTIVSLEGRPVLVVGARGGSRIITAVLQCILNAIDYGLPPERAVAAPRFHHQWSPGYLSFERGAFAPAVSIGLERLGHLLATRPSGVGELNAIFIDPATGALTGVPDPREGGVAAGR